MSNADLAAYRELYTNRHGIQCPLSDAQILAALETATVSPGLYPRQLTVLTAMEATVASEFPAVDQGRYQLAGTMLAPQDMALDNASAEGFDVNFSLPTGGNPPYSIQLQIAPDDTGEPGTYADHGVAQDDDTEIVVTGLDAETAYWARLEITDNLGDVKYSNEETLTTGSAG